MLDQKNSLTNGDSGLHLSPPQKSLPDLPPPKVSLSQPLLFTASAWGSEPLEASPLSGPVQHGWVEKPLPVSVSEAKSPGELYFKNSNKTLN